MYAVSKSRFVRKLAALSILTLSLAYLRKPEPVYATSCQQQCLNTEHECVAGCGGNSQCSNECILEFKSCVNGCR